MRNGKDQGEPFLACLLDFAPQISHSIRVSMKILMSFIYKTCLINSWLGVLINRTWYCKQFYSICTQFFLSLISNTFLSSKGFASFANQIFYILTIMKNIFCQHDVWLDLSRYISCGGARLPLILTTSATIWLLLLLSRAFGTFHITSTAKLYIPSNLNINLMLWYTQLIVCDVNC